MSVKKLSFSELSLDADLTQYTDNVNTARQNALDSKFSLKKLPNEDSPISQSKQNRIDAFMNIFKQEREFQPPEVQSMVDALHSDKIDNIAATMNGFAKAIKDDIVTLVGKYKDVNEEINDIFSVVGLKYFDSNLSYKIT